jgi:hypothetical protein
MAKGECNCGVVQRRSTRNFLMSSCALLDLSQVHGEQWHRGGCRSE